MVGVGGDELTRPRARPGPHPPAIIAGPPRSGRSTALLAVVESLLRGGAEVVIAAPRPSPLRDLAGRGGRAARVHRRASSRARSSSRSWTRATGPVVLVVDDGELLKDIEAKDYLKAVQRTGADRGRAIVLGGDSGEVAGGFSGWQVDMKGRQGVLISPQSITDGELIGVRVPRSSLGNNPAGGPGDGQLRRRHPARHPGPDRLRATATGGPGHDERARRGPGRNRARDPSPRRTGPRATLEPDRGQPSELASCSSVSWSALAAWVRYSPIPSRPSMVLVTPVSNSS